MVPVNKGEEYIIDIESISSDGNGVAHIQGFAVFVPDTCAGDTVKARIMRVKPRFATAAVSEIIEKSISRIEPACPYNADCGGCQIAHMNYDAQLDEKRRIVENNIRRIGGFDGFCLDEIIAAENPVRYRNKAVFQLENKKDGIISGFYSRKSHSVRAVSDCMICGSDFAKIAAAAARYMTEFNVPIYSEKSKHGVKNIFVRESKKTGEIMTVIFADLKKLPHEEELVNRISAAGNVSSVLLDCGKSCRALYGNNTLLEEICGIRFKVSHKSFLQVNHAQTERLYSKALEFADIKNTDTVMDIYCGIGTISLCAARTAKKVIGIEKVERAIFDAKENAMLNNINNAEFYAADAEELVPKLIENGARADIVILDPPRAGSDVKTLAAINSASPKRIVYISCDSASLARDLKFLRENGWEINRSAACDMFPHTMHIETVCLLVRRNPDTRINIDIDMG